MDKIRQRLLELLKKDAFRKGKRTLSSGKKSDYYLDAKRVTLTGEGVYLTAKLILKLLKKEKITAVGGPTLGADSIVGAIAALSHAEGRPMNAFIVRKEPKKYGMGKFIEGPAISRGSRVIIIEDVVTTGTSVLKAIEVVRKAGGRVSKVIALVDRLEGAEERLRRKRCSLVSLFTCCDFGINS